MANTPWSGAADDKLYLQSGQFSSTLKTSQAVAPIDVTPTDISWDGINTPWCGDQYKKLYLTSGQFSSTIKISEDVSGVDNVVVGISWDGMNTPWVGIQYIKLYLQSGQFSSTVKTSQVVSSIDGTPTGVSWDGVNSPWSGLTDDKLYLQSGQFTSTLKTSLFVGGVELSPHSITWDGINSPWCGSVDNKLYLQSGQFTSTLKTSEDIGSIEGVVTGIETNDVISRLMPVRSTDSTLNFSQLVNVTGVISRDIITILNISQDIQTAQIQPRTLENQIDFISYTFKNVLASASNTMNLAQGIFKLYIPFDFIPVSSEIIFLSQVGFDLGLYEQIFQSITFTQQLEWLGPRYHQISAYLTLDQVASGFRGVPWLPVELGHTLNFLNIANLSHLLNVNSVMVLIQDTFRREVLESSLALIQALENGKTKGMLPTELNLLQVVDLRAEWVRQLAHANAIKHSLAYSIILPCSDKQYGSFIGESTVDDAPSPPPMEEPIVLSDATSSRFKLKYPALSAPIDEIVLRAPELDNIDRLAFNRINRETRGGKLTVFADPNWPQVQTVIATFIGLTKAEIDSLLDFIVSHIGEEIGIQDWEGREWAGVITTPNEAAIQDGESCSGRGWTITFEFEGILIDNFIPGDRINLTSSLNLEMQYVRDLDSSINFIDYATFLLVS